MIASAYSAITRPLRGAARAATPVAAPRPRVQKAAVTSPPATPSPLTASPSTATTVATKHAARRRNPHPATTRRARGLGA